MPAPAIILAGAVAIGSLIAVPSVVVSNALRAEKAAAFHTVMTLLLWVCASAVLAGIWFIVAVAAHKTDEALALVWVVANAAYPIVGLSIVWIHRRLLS